MAAEKGREKEGEGRGGGERERERYSGRIKFFEWPVQKKGGGSLEQRGPPYSSGTSPERREL